MLKKYFAEFYVPEDKLKEEIYDTLNSLVTCVPEFWSEEILEQANPQKSSEEIIKNLSERIPQIKARLRAYNIAYTEESLRDVVFTLDAILSEKQLEFYFLRQIYSLFANQILGVRYYIALEIISKKYPDELKPDSESIRLALMDRTLKISPLDLFVAARKAEEVIERVKSDKDVGQTFMEVIRKFESSVDDEIKKNLNEIIKGSIFMAYAGAFIKNVNLVNNSLQLDKLSNKNLKNWFESILKEVKETTKLRLEIKDERGGAHNIKEFSFKDEQKLKFFNTVENLPPKFIKKGNGKKTEASVWEYALEKLIEEDFDSLFANQLKERLVLEGISESLFKRAVKTWRKYLHDGNWNEMKLEDKPRAFEFLHALELLGYPKNYKYSSLESYYYKGKSIQKISDFQN